MKTLTSNFRTTEDLSSFSLVHLESPSVPATAIALRARRGAAGGSACDVVTSPDLAAVAG